MTQITIQVGTLALVEGPDYISVYQCATQDTEPEHLGRFSEQELRDWVTENT